MSLTVLEIVKQALWPIAGAQPPSSSLTSTSVTQEIQLRTILYDVSRELRREIRGATQKRTHSFDLSSGISGYQLPKDFYAAIIDTQYDTDQDWQLDGPLSDSAFQGKVYRQSGATVSAYRVFGPDANPNSAGGQFKVYPTPTSSGTTLAFDYITSSLFFPPNWTPSEASITVGKYRNANGNIYKCSAITTGTTSTTAPSHTTGTAVDGGVTWQYYSDAYETIQTSDDLSLFDDELIILGVRVHYMEGKRKDPGMHKTNYENAKRVARTRFNGSFTGSFGSECGGPRYSVPDGGWSF